MTTWTTKVDGVDKVMADHVNKLQTYKMDRDLIPFVFPEEYGAVGNGVTDDTIAIKAAISALGTTGGGVRFATNKTYKLTTGLLIPSGIHIIGSGPSTVLMQYGTSAPPDYGVLLYFQSTTSATRTASGALAAGDTDLTLSSVAGLNIGDTVFLQLGEAKYDPTQPYISMFNVVSDIVGNVVTFSVSFPEDVYGTDHKCLLLSSIVDGGGVYDITLAADASATPDQAVIVERGRNFTARNVFVNHTGALVNSQSENVLFENIYFRRSRYYGGYAASGHMIGGWGFRNFKITNLFGLEIDRQGIYFEAEGRGAVIDNFVYQTGADYDTVSNNIGLRVMGDCKGIYVKNYHYNCPYATGGVLLVSEESECKTEDVFVYNGGNDFNLKNHAGMLGWDRDTGTMEYYNETKKITKIITLFPSMSGTIALPSGIYKNVKAYTGSASKITNLTFNTSGGDLHASLVDNELSDLSVAALTSIGPNAAYPFNNTLAKSVTIETDGTVVSGERLALQIEYYPSADDESLALLQAGYPPGVANIDSIMTNVVIASENLITNGDFESGVDDWLAALPGDCSLASVAGGQAGNCLEITRIGGVDQAAAFVFMPPAAGGTYSLSFYVKSGSSGNEEFHGYVTDDVGNAWNLVSGTSSGSWVQYSLTFTYLEGIPYAVISLKKKTATAGTMLFDTVVLNETISGNVGIGISPWSSDGKAVMIQKTQAAPTVSPADAYQQYSDTVASGNAAPHFRTEDGSIIKLYRIPDIDFAITPNSGDADTDTLIEKIRDALLDLGLIDDASA